MLRFVLLVVDLFQVLPWWGAVTVLVSSALGLWVLGHYIVRRLFREVTEAVIAEGLPLADALVNVHSVEPVEPPTEPSLIGFDPDDENYDPDLDGLDAAEATGYFRVDATIAPRDPEATWDPSALFLVEREFEPEEELDFCETMATIHTLEVWRNGGFVLAREGNVAGPQRLRMVFAVPHGLADAKFAYHFTYFGRLALPAPVALAHI
jgi:hypothetical protein